MCYKTRGEAQAIGIIGHEKALGRPIVALLAAEHVSGACIDASRRQEDGIAIRACDTVARVVVIF